MLLVFIIVASNIHFFTAMINMRQPFCSVCLQGANGHVCILKERSDPSSATKELKWSLPFKGRCFCQGVVTAINKSRQPCTLEGDSEPEFWFVNDPIPLIHRSSWNQGRLDELLQRTGYCGKFILFFVCLFVCFLLCFFKLGMGFNFHKYDK